MVLINQSERKIAESKIHMASALIPKFSKAIVLRTYGDKPMLEVVERETPQPKAGQVLVKMAAAPINPSDLLFLQEKYGIYKNPPIVPGIEGSGTVVAVGKGFISKMLLGRRVACSGLTIGDGTWAEYALVSADHCIEVASDITDEQAACMFVNPWTAIAMLEEAHKLKKRSIVLTAGASQLSRMIFRLAQKRGIKTIHIVRSPEQVDFLKNAVGVSNVLNSRELNFETQLGEMCDQLNTTLAFDAVAGEMTGILARNMPSNSIVMVYGSLSSQSTHVEVGDLLFRGSRVQGFWLNHWLAQKHLLQLFWLGKTSQRLLGDDCRTEIRERLPLNDIYRALELAAVNATNGKILLVP